MAGTQLRISVTLSGGAALGAYQAGVMAGLATALQHLLEREEDCVWLDAIGGASAGSMVALFSAHALLEGIDPVELLRDSWVDRVSLDFLRGGTDAPLDLENLRRGLREMLAPRERTKVRQVSARHRRPIGLHVALTGLQGLTYSLRSVRREATISATTHTDWGQFVLGGDDGVPLFEPEGAAPVDHVLASAAHPAAFAPQLLDRRGDAEAFRARGIRDFPDSGHLWYTDGGVLQSQPLGRVLAAARRTDVDVRDGRDLRRVNIMVDPRSEGPSGATRWSDPERRPDWLSALTRTVAILSVQALYDDLRRVEERNTRLEWAEDLVRALAPHLDHGAGAALDELLDRIDSEQDRAGASGSRRRGSLSVVQKLRRSIDEISGLVDKEKIDVDVISPLLLEQEGESVPRLLAGEFMGDFGGFLSQDLRRSDFVLGYASARSWLPHALEHAGIEGGLRESTLEAVDARSPGDWRQANLGKFAASDLSWRNRWAIARLMLHAIRIAVAGSRAVPAPELGRRLRSAGSALRSRLGARRSSR